MCISRKVLATFFDHGRILDKKFQESVGDLQSAIRRKITHIHSQNVLLANDISEAVDKCKNNDKEEAKAYIRGKAISETLATAKAIAKDLFNMFATFASRTGQADAEHQERSGEQTKNIEALQKEYGEILSEFMPNRDYLQKLHFNPKINNPY